MTKENKESSCVTVPQLNALIKALKKLEIWCRSNGTSLPCLRLIHATTRGKITALVELGPLAIKLVLKDGEWEVVGGDAVKQ